VEELVGESYFCPGYPCERLTEEAEFLDENTVPAPDNKRCIPDCNHRLGRGLSLFQGLFQKGIFLLTREIRPLACIAWISAFSPIHQPLDARHTL
jgi:hypothetical protein